jgi:hypothetical protein
MNKEDKRIFGKIFHGIGVATVCALCGYCIVCFNSYNIKKFSNREKIEKRLDRLEQARFIYKSVPVHIDVEPYVRPVWDGPALTNDICRCGKGE